MKDWEHWKQQFLEERIDSTRNWFKWIEQHKLTPIENIAMMYLQDFVNDFYPFELSLKPQYQIEKYRVDFLVHDSWTDTKIVVECDGHDFHEKTKKQAEHDKRRDRFLVKQGYVVLRYTGSQICENPDEIVRDVSEILLCTAEKQQSNAG